MAGERHRGPWGGPRGEAEPKVHAAVCTRVVLRGSDGGEEAKRVPLPRSLFRPSVSPHSRASSAPKRTRRTVDMRSTTLRRTQRSSSPLNPQETAPSPSSDPPTLLRTPTSGPPAATCLRSSVCTLVSRGHPARPPPPASASQVPLALRPPTRPHPYPSCSASSMPGPVASGSSCMRHCRVALRASRTSAFKTSAPGSRSSTQPSSTSSTLCRSFRPLPRPPR